MDKGETRIRSTIEAIRSMQVRGAAAIGIAAAQALADAVQAFPDADLQGRARKAARRLDGARPTAVSLHNALGGVLQAMAAESSPTGKRRAAQDCARRVETDARAARLAIARHGARLVHDGDVVLTHCNSSTAVAALARAKDDGKDIDVIATETRPFGQGLLTVAALRKAGVRCTLVVDSAVEHILSTRDVELVLVGADAVASDGSLFNKIGTAGVAALADAHDVPFYSAAGAHKFTRRRPDEVPIEERPASEVVAAARLPRGARVFNPVFDRTPPAHITGYLTESGLVAPRVAARRGLAHLPPEEVWA